MNRTQKTSGTCTVRPSRREWRVLKWAALTVVALLLLAWLLLVVLGSYVIKGAINNVGPVALGVPVSVEDVTFHPLRGAVLLRGLHVGNPKGFKTPGLFDLKEIDIRLEPRSILRPPLHIQSIRVRDPVVTYELALGKSNIGVLLKSLEGDKPDAETTKAADAGGAKGKVIIDELVVEGARVRISATIMQGASAPIPLPRIALHDIGKEKGGATWLEATKSTLAAVGNAIGHAVTGLGGAAVDGVKAIGSGIGNLFSGRSTNAVETNAPAAGK